MIAFAEKQGKLRSFADPLRELASPIKINRGTMSQDTADRSRELNALHEPECIELWMQRRTNRRRAPPERADAIIKRSDLALARGFDWSLFQRGIAAAFAGIKR